MDDSEEQNKERQQMKTNEREREQEKTDISHAEKAFSKGDGVLSLFFSLSLVLRCLLFIIIVIAFSPLLCSS